MPEITNNIPSDKVDKVLYSMEKEFGPRPDGLTDKEWLQAIVRRYIIKICTNPNCGKHRGIKDSSFRKTPAEIKKERVQRKADLLKKERDNKKLLQALGKIKWPMSEKHLEVFIEAMVLRYGFTVVRPIVLRHGWKVLRTHQPYTKKGVTSPDYELTVKEEMKKMVPAEKLRLVMEFCIENLWSDRRAKIIKSL